jgi:hypothetical protein
MADGRLGKCKECTKSDSTQNRNANLERIREYDRERAKEPKSRATKARVTKDWIKQNPQAYFAQNTLGNAVRDGKIAKADSCSSCGASTKRIHGHHCDYAKPLEVIWLCVPCHKAWHIMNGNGKNMHGN